MPRITAPPIDPSAHTPFVDMHPAVLPAFTSLGPHDVVCSKCSSTLLAHVWATQVAGFGVWCPHCGTHCKVPREPEEAMMRELPS
jgi:hypothetical protein